MYIEGHNLEKLYAHLLKKSVRWIVELPPELDTLKESEPAVYKINFVKK